MHITSETDYAIRITDCLARANERMGASAISEKTCVSLRFSLKILRKLVAVGIIRSYKGSRGGYELAKKPEDITLGEIIDAIEGKYMLSRCLRDGHICTRVANEDLCPYHRYFDALSGQVQNQLNSTTIAEMMDSGWKEDTQQMEILRIN